MLSNIRSILFKFVLLWVTFLSYASASAISISDLDEQVSIINDSSFLFSQYLISDIKQLKSLPRSHWQDKLNTFVFNGGEFWIKTIVTNPSNNSLTKILYFERANVFEIDLYHFDSANQLLQSFETGSNRPLENKPIHANGFAFELIFAPNTSSIIYTRLNSTGLNRFAMDILSKEYFEDTMQSRHSWEISFYSIWIFLFFYNISVFLLTRESIFFAFSFFPVLMATLSSTDSGFLYDLVPALRGDIGLKVEMIALCCIIFFLASISEIFKRLRKSHPFIYFMNVFIKVSAVCLAILCLMPNYLGATKIVILLCTITLLTTAFQIYYLALKKYHLFAVLSVVWTIFMVGAGISFLNAIGSLEKSVITDNSVHWSILLSYSLLSLTIVKKLQEEKTSAKHAMIESRKNITRFYDIFLNAEEGIFSCNDEGIIKDANPALCSLLQNDHPQGKNIGSWFYNEADKISIFEELQTSGRIKNREVMFLDTKHRVYWLSINLRIMSEQKNNAEKIKGTMVDISDLKATEQKLNYVADHDHLTGLINRTKMLDEVNLMLKKHNFCYGININLDSFSAINDTCGQQAGNQLLREISNLLVGTIKTKHHIARIQSDEFFILLPNINNEDGLSFSLKIKQALSPYTFEWDQKNFKINASLGCAAFENNDNDNDIRTIYERCVISLKQAKINGGNRIEYYDINDHNDQQADLLLNGYHRINEALKNNDFVLFYQPIKPLTSTEGVHYEVLIRLMEKSGNIIAPGEFLPSAERFNLMQDIDRWVINSFFDWLVKNPDHVSQLECASINLSGSTLSTPESIDRIRELFNHYKVDPNKICFEITESMAITHLETTKRFIQTFKAMGCRFSLDDFGTGYSSYSYLANLDVDYVKIDGSFVKDIVSSTANKAMVKSIHDVAMAMGLKTIAEFVENDAIENELKIMGIHYAQGYAIAKPQALTNWSNPQTKTS
ncbi:MAG: EAL domain-containing protein [Saccharospirillaceae bacterium]|nr:EAL domain-containing protein [Pseudomonadales bacterium]NRB80968.1 EAL domain-containing protein [Saccharospirillaceae bacterium]